MRIAAMRHTLDSRLPGVYPAGQNTDRRIVKALAEFPAKKAGYDRAVRTFPDALARAFSPAIGSSCSSAPT